MIFEFSGRIFDEDLGTHDYAPTFVIASKLEAVTSHPEIEHVSLLLVGGVLYEVSGDPAAIVDAIKTQVEPEYLT